MALRVASFLWPGFTPDYEAVGKRVAEHLGTELSFRSVERSDSAATEVFDMAFLCGWPLVQAWDQGAEFVPIAAPIPRGERYGGRAVYFSDVVVAEGHPAQSMDDLRDARWAVNETSSQSGWNILRHWAVSAGALDNLERNHLLSGSHNASLVAIAEGRADAAAVDSQITDALATDESGPLRGLRVIHSLGPSPIQPVVVRGDLAERETIRKCLLEMTLADAAPWDRFARVDAEDYECIRQMGLNARAQRRT